MKEYKKELLGFTAGNFDLLHPGYIITFEEAKKHCDKLIVFLQIDPSLHRKSKYKPVIPLYDRYKALMSIRYIDDVYIYQTEEDLYELIKFFKPDIRILGEDYIGKVFTAKGNGWYPSGSIRHPKFKGWRDDKRADEWSIEQIPNTMR